VPTVNLGSQDVHYIERGAGDTLLIFPDNMHAATAYEAEIAYFSERFHVLSFDMPGSGGSSREVLYPDEVAFDPWNCAADYACHILQELGKSECYALGTGLGALPVLHLAGKQAALHRIEVRAAIADSFLSDLDGRTLHRWLDVREHYLVRRVQWMAEQHGDDWRDVVDADTAFLRNIADHGGYEMPEGVLNSIACPILLTGNLNDAVTPGIAAQFARLAAIIPDCAIHLASRSGHRYADEHPLLHTAPGKFRTVADLFLAGWQVKE